LMMATVRNNTTAKTCLWRRSITDCIFEIAVRTPTVAVRLAPWGHVSVVICLPLGSSVQLRSGRAHRPSGVFFSLKCSGARAAARARQMRPAPVSSAGL
jgi:hypothetical protein